jgi:ABC-type sugar transport system ATPase subunit
VQALQDVSLSVDRGEVHAVVGENGAGKSTLMKIIAGALQPDAGTIEFEGSAVRFSGPRDASRLGIAIVYQEPSIFPELSVLENFYLGDELTGSGGRLRWADMAEDAASALRQIGLPAGIMGTRMADLSLGAQQLVMIARAVHKNARLLILDEPTSILSQAETEVLFRTILSLKAHDVSVLYISHRLAEIFRIADRVTVLRDGRVAGRFSVQEATEDALITAMVGRQIDRDVYRPRPFADLPPVLEVRHLSSAGHYRDVSFVLRPGEVLGLYGLVGAGRSEVAQTIFGEIQPDSGQIMLDGRVIKMHSATDAIRMGISYIPEDRRTQGLFLTRAVRDNLSVSLLSRIAGRLLGLLDERRELHLTEQEVKRFNIKTGSAMTPVGELSGGNQQKVVLARWLAHNPRVLLLDEPTRGVDIGTKVEIHRLIMHLAGQGMAILLISSDLPEVLALADNVLIMHEGVVTGYLPREQATEAVVLRLALGLPTQEQELQGLNPQSQTYAGWKDAERT